MSFRPLHSVCGRGGGFVLAFGIVRVGIWLRLQGLAASFQQANRLNLPWLCQVEPKHSGAGAVLDGEAMASNLRAMAASNLLAKEPNCDGLQPIKMMNAQKLVYAH